VQAKQAAEATKNKTHNREQSQRTRTGLKTRTNAAGQLGIFAGGGGTRRSIKAKALPKKRNYLLKRRQRTLSGASFFPGTKHTHTHTHTQTKNNKNGNKLNENSRKVQQKNREKGN